MTIQTPESHPNHHTIGKKFVAWDDHIYYCDSYDPTAGYWMTREDAPEENRQDRSGDWRQCVSKLAIGRTFREIYLINGEEFTSFGPVRRPKGKE